CLSEVMVIVSGLSVQDPRERPAEKSEAADALHRRFWAPMATEDTDPTPDGSDFMAWLRLWDHLVERQQSLSGNGFRRMCSDEFLHYLRIREWQDLHTQLRPITRELKMERNRQRSDAATIHTAMLSGLL